MTRYSFGSLRVRLILLVLMVAIPALGLMLYSGLEQRGQARQHASDDALRLAQVTSVGQERMIENGRQILFTLSKMPQIQEQKKTECRMVLANLQKQSQGYTGFLAIKPNGDVFASAQTLAGPTNLADRPWFKRLVQTRRFVIGEYVIGRVSGKPTVILAYPVLDNIGQLKAILSTGLDLEWLNQLIAKSNLPKGTSLNVIDSNGTLLLRHPEPEKFVGKSVPEAAIFKAILAKKEGVAEAIGLDGVPRLYGFTTLGHTPEAIYVSVGIPKKVAFAEADRTMTRNLIFLGLMAVLALLAAWFIGGLFIVHPVNHLLNVTRRLADGDLTVRSGQSYEQGEIGLLARSFDQMAESLERRETESKKMGEELKKRNQMLEMASVSANVALWDWDLESNELEWSNNIDAMLGYEPNGFPRNLQAWEEMIHPQDKEDVMEKLNTHLEYNIPYNTEYRVRKKDGSYISWHDRRQATRDKDGKAYRMSGACVDISERKQAEVALRTSEKEAKRLSQENSVVAEIGRIISLTLNIEDVYEGFAKEANKLVPFDRITINTINPEERTLTIAYTTGVEIVERRQGDVIPLTGTATETAVQAKSGQIIQSDDEKEMETHFPGLLPSLRAGLRSSLAVPLISKDQAIGVLHFRSKKPNAYSERDLRLAEKVGNQIAGAVANSQLFAEHKRAQESLAESEKRYRQVVENATEIIYSLNTKGNFTYGNPAGLKVTGFSLEELRQFNYQDLIVPEHRERITSIYIKQFRERQATTHLEFPFFNKSGEVVWIGQNASLVIEDGKVVGFHIISRDITERKHAEEALRSSEEKYRTILENIEDGYYEIDIAGNFTFFNDSVCRILGYSKEEMVGMNFRQYTDQESAKKIYQIFNMVYRTGQPVRISDWDSIRKDGTKRCHEGSVSLIKDSSGNRTGFRGIVRDITERKKAEKERANLEEQLRQSQKMEAIGHLAGGIAHDFNNLLTIIKGYSQLSLLELKEGDPLKENTEEIQKAADRAANLTRQLLAFSRRQVLEMKVLDLNTLLGDLEKMLRRTISEDIELVTLMADNLERVKVDPGQIEQAVMNLAVNARDVMPNGGKLTIETANVELDEAYARQHTSVVPGRYVMLSVSDTGAGMTPEIKEKIFEPFFTTKEKGKGTGLGLSTVYGIVKQSGGNIWVYSEPGQGTAFKIYFPRMDEPLDEIEKKVLKEEIPRGNETILLVEDDDDVLKLAVQVLMKQGYRVLDAPQGLDAFLIAEKHQGPIHLLVTDVVMPKVNGHELAERMATIRPGIKVLYMSGYTDNAIAHHGILEKGMNYIQKPFSVDGLAIKVREVLDK